MNRTASMVAAVSVSLALIGTARAQTPENCVLSPERFAALDVNHDGKLSVQEFKACAADKAGVPSLDDQFATIDRDHDGAVTQAEAKMFLAEAPLDATTPPAGSPSADQPAAKPGQGQPMATDAGRSAAADQPVPRTADSGQPPAAVAQPQAGQQAPAEAGPPAVDPHQLQAMAGTEAVTMDGKKVGSMAKVVAGPNNSYAAVIDTGGFLGIGTTQRLVPLDQIRMQNKQIVLNMSQDQLDQLPKLDQRQWKDLGQ